MGLEKPYNGAWQDVESVNKPKNNAWQECEVVNKPKNGAWEEIWSAVKFLVLWEESLSTGFLESKEEYTEVIAVDDSGTIAFVTEKDSFSDAVITFGFEGGIHYFTATGTERYVQAGTLSIFGVDASGNTTTFASYDVGSSSSYSEWGDYSVNATGNFVRIGWKMSFKNWSISPTAGNIVTNELTVGEFKINKKKYYTNPANDYDHNDWYN